MKLRAKYNNQTVEIVGFIADPRGARAVFVRGGFLNEAPIGDFLIEVEPTEKFPLNYASTSDSNTSKKGKNQK